MVNVPATVPSAEALLMFSVPAVSVVPLVYRFAPANVSVPAPDFVSSRPAPEMTPLTRNVFAVVVITGSAVIVTAAAAKVKLFEPTKVKLPPQLMGYALVVMAAPEVLSMLPPLIVNVPAVVPRAEALFILMVPAVSVVPPVKVFALESVRVPAPVFCIWKPVPEITEDTVRSDADVPSFAIVNTRDAPRASGAAIVAPNVPDPALATVILPPSVRVPEPVIEDPLVSPPHCNFNSLGLVILKVDIANVDPAFTVSGADVKDLFPFKVMTPVFLITTPPVAMNGVTHSLRVTVLAVAVLY